MSNINVLYRVKNITDDKILTVKNNCMKIQDNRPRSYSEKPKFKIYKKLNIFDSYCDNHTIYDTYFNPKINMFLSNNLSTFSTLLYGQTGSGKTYTLFGNNNTNGLTHHILNFLLSKNIKLTVSALEIYNNTVSDIINHGYNIRVFDSGNNRSILNEIKKIHISDSTKIDTEIKKILYYRASGKTKLNDTSSRSHLIISINFSLNGVQKKIYLIDLAGTEKGKYSIVNSKQDKLEKININKSLFALKECIRAFSNKNNYIPFRNSKLTILLKDAFFNNGFIVFVGTLNPLMKCYYDIIDTVEYGNSLSKVRIVIDINKKPSSTMLLNHYLDYIMDINKQIRKDYKVYQKISDDVKKKKYLTKPSEYIDNIMPLFSNKINVKKKFCKEFEKYKE